MSAKITGRRSDDMAEYLIAFKADGSVQQLWLLDAVPDLSVGKELRAVATHVRVNAVAEGSDLRYGLVPLQLNYQQYKVRPAN